MKIEPAIVTILYNSFNIRLTSSVRGTNVLTNHDYLNTDPYADLPDVISNSYVDVLLQKYTVERIGFIETYSVTVVLRTGVNGNGSIKWQISGDGGANWTTIIEQSFNVGVFTDISRQGSGQWITSINIGHEQLQVRLQALANSGTVNLKLSDDFCQLQISYKQKQN